MVILGSTFFQCMKTWAKTTIKPRTARPPHLPQHQGGEPTPPKRQFWILKVRIKSVWIGKCFREKSGRGSCEDLIWFDIFGPLLHNSCPCWPMSLSCPADHLEATFASAYLWRLEMVEMGPTWSNLCWDHWDSCRECLRQGLSSLCLNKWHLISTYHGYYSTSIHL